jgi:hypothetical protein
MRLFLELGVQIFIMNESPRVPASSLGAMVVVDAASALSRAPFVVVGCYSGGGASPDTRSQ